MRRGPVLAGSIAVALIATYAVALGLPRGRTVDAKARAELASLSATRELETFDNILELVWLALLGAALLAVWNVLRGRRARGLAALGLLGVTNAAAYGLGWTLYELDPLGGEAHRGEDMMFFPSGHAATAASIGLAAIVLAPGGRRWLVAIGAGAGIAAVGVASVVEGSHYPSDVVGAYVLALALASLVSGLVGGTPGGRTPPPVAAATLAGAAALGLAVLTIGDGIGPRGLIETGWSGGLAAGLLVLFGAGLPVAYLAVADPAQPARNAALAAKKPHIPWTPPPGGVEEEQR